MQICSLCELPDEPSEGRKRLGAHVMLDSLRILTGRFGAHSERKQKRFDHTMPVAGIGRKALPGFGQKHAPVRLLRNKPFFAKALQHLRDGRLSHAEPAGDVHLPRFPLRRNQIVDELDIVLHELKLPGLTRLTEARRLKISVNKTFGFDFLSVCHRTSRDTRFETP